MKFELGSWCVRYTTASGPHFSLIAVSFSATKEKASSHEMRSNRPGSPFGLVRRIGYFNRSGSWVTYQLAMPLAHRVPMLFGASGFPLW